MVLACADEDAGVRHRGEREQCGHGLPCGQRGEDAESEPVRATVGRFEQAVEGYDFAAARAILDAHKP